VRREDKVFGLILDHGAGAGLDHVRVLMMTETSTPKVTVTKVTVREPFRLVHETKVYTAGDTFSVDKATAARWEQAGWVERVTSNPAPRKS
jgi:hypothetical protein